MSVGVLEDYNLKRFTRLWGRQVKGEAFLFFFAKIVLSMVGTGGAEAEDAKLGIWEPLMRDIALEAQEHPAAVLSEAT